MSTLFPQEQLAHQELPLPPTKKKRPRIASKEQISTRQLFYRDLMRIAVASKQKNYQKWPTHVVVQAGKVFRNAANLMDAAAQMKETPSETPEQRGARFMKYQEMKDLAVLTMASAIRFLERLKKPVASSDDIQAVLGTANITPNKDALLLINTMLMNEIMTEQDPSEAIYGDDNPEVHSSEIPVDPIAITFGNEARMEGE